MKQQDKVLQGDLSLESVTLQLGLCCVLSDVTIRLPLDGVILLRGRNGVGKTSFLRSLLGLITPQKGKITLWGKPPQQARSFIGMMSQKAGDAAPMLPVMSHVMASIDGSRWGFSLSSRRYQQAWALLQLVGAEGLAQQPLGVLSGGERQRVALAQALAGTPSLLILDEPLAALDSIARQETLTLLQHLHEQLGLVVMMTLHEEVKVEKYFAPLREVWLEGGKFRA